MRRKLPAILNILRPNINKNNDLLINFAKITAKLTGNVYK